jgi:septum formation protein
MFLLIWWYNVNKQIILASQSPRRKYLLSTIIGEEFIICKSNYEEDNKLNINPIELAKKHAFGKANDVAKKFDSGIVIGGDVFVVLDGEVLGKPKDEEDAFLMLKKQQGKETLVISGLAVIDIDNNKTYIEHEVTKLKMSKLNDDEILNYINTKDPMDKAGSFGMQDKGGILVEKVNGSYSNVVGLPLNKLHKIFRKIGIKIFDY